MPVPYTPLAVANNFLDRFGRDGGIEHMKLQKLVYFSYGIWLATRNESPLTSEGPEVWKYGPVFNSLFQALKVFGREKITEPQSLDPFEKPENIAHDEDGVLNFINWVWGRYGHLSGFALSDMTHQNGRGLHL